MGQNGSRLDGNCVGRTDCKRNVFLKFKCNELFSLINPLSKLKENMIKHLKFG